MGPPQHRRSPPPGIGPPRRPRFGAMTASALGALGQGGSMNWAHEFIGLSSLQPSFQIDGSMNHFPLSSSTAHIFPNMGQSFFIDQCQQDLLRDARRSEIRLTKEDYDELAGQLSMSDSDDDEAKTWSADLGSLGNL